MQGGDAKLTWWWEEEVKGPRRRGVVLCNGGKASVRSLLTAKSAYAKGNGGR